MRVVIMGKPFGKQRPKFAYNGTIGYCKAYTPRETKEYEQLVKWEYHRQCGQYFTDPVRVDIVVKFEILKGTSKAEIVKCVDGEIRPAKKPDIDNEVKVLLDALNNVEVKDESQGVEGKVSKVYSLTPCVEFEVTRV